MVFTATVLATSLTIMVFAQLETERHILASQDEHTRNLLRTVKLNVENQYKSYRFHREALLRERKSELENISGLALLQVQAIYEQVKSGILPESQACQKAIESVRRMRYTDGVGYVWIQDAGKPYPRIIMHPAFPHLEGRLGDDPAMDSEWGGASNFLPEIVDIGLRDGEGYVDYSWPKPTPDGLIEHKSKISHVRYFEPWGWILGTGLYVDDIELQSQQRLDAIVGELRQTLAEVRIAETGYMFMFTGKRQTLIHRNPDALKDGDLKNPVTGEFILDELMAAARTPDVAWRYLWNKPPHDTREYRYPKQAYVTHFEPLDWYIGASVYEDEIQAPATALRWKVLAVSGVFMLMAIAISSLLARNLTRPLTRLAAAARDIEAKGSPDLRSRSAERWRHGNWEAAWTPCSNPFMPPAGRKRLCSGNCAAARRTCVPHCIRSAMRSLPQIPPGSSPV